VVERVRGGQGDALFEKVWLLHALNKVWQDFCIRMRVSILVCFQALEDKEHRMLLQYCDQMRGEGAGDINGVVLWEF
jgi:hypothetical protein